MYVYMSASACVSEDSLRNIASNVVKILEHSEINNIHVWQPVCEKRVDILTHTL